MCLNTGGIIITHYALHITHYSIQQVELRSSMGVDDNYNIILSLQNHHHALNLLSLLDVICALSSYCSNLIEIWEQHELSQPILSDSNITCNVMRDTSFRTTLAERSPASIKDIRWWPFDKRSSPEARIVPTLRDFQWRNEGMCQSKEKSHISRWAS